MGLKNKSLGDLYPEHHSRERFVETSPERKSIPAYFVFPVYLGNLELQGLVKLPPVPNSS